jgi:DNA polymerase
MRLVLNTLVEELKRLKQAGVQSVSVSDGTLAALRHAIRGRAAPTVPAAVAVPVAVAAPPSPTFTPTPAAPKPQPRPQPKLPAPTPFVLPEGDKAARWAWLKERVLNDPVCRANVRPGKQVVLGVGSLEASIFFVGEAPGAEEEIRGEPFVGPAGQLLTKMITAMGLKREQVYIGNIMNWRPQLPPGADGEQRGNREPNEEEMTYCLPHLRAQIEVVQPRLLVALGATAAKGLLGAGSFKTLGELRGRWHDYQSRPLLVTYHPSYLLRKEAESKLGERKAKRAAWEDFLRVMEKEGMPISEKQRSYFRDP